MGVPDAKSNPEAKRSGLSTSEQWLASVLLLRHARHLFGSPRTHLFMMAAELSLGLGVPKLGDINLFCILNIPYEPSQRK